MVQNAKMPIVTNPFKYLCSQKMAAIRYVLLCYEEKKNNLIGLDLYLKFSIVAMESRCALFSSHEVHATYNAA